MTSDQAAGVRWVCDKLIARVEGCAAVDVKGWLCEVEVIDDLDRKIAEETDHDDRTWHV